MQMEPCELCKIYGFKFNRNYSPDDFIEGKLSSKIWIVGLNPKGDIDSEDIRTKEDLASFFNSKDSDLPEDRKKYSYFKDFKKASEMIYDLIGKENGVAHTDIVKCFSNEFPPDGIKGKEIQEIIMNCSTYLKKQIEIYKPRMIICNGADVCKVIRSIIQPIEGKEHDTYYIGKVRDVKVAIVLSGFIGRIDDYSKRRLGLEIEALVEEIELKFS